MPEDEEEKPDDEEKPEDENEEPVDEAENPGCKDLDDMIPEDSGLEIGCKVNGKKQFICKLECPEGTNFMGKDGKPKILNESFSGPKRTIDGQKRRSMRVKMNGRK